MARDTKLVDVLTLTKAQQKKFDALKKAYKACESSGIKFINVYGSLYAVPKANVADYGDRNFTPEGEELVELHGYFPADYMNIASEWCDDNHVVGLTKKGSKIYNSDEEE